MAPEKGAIQRGFRANFTEMVAHQIRERGSTRRPAFRRAASLNRGPTSCRLVVGTILSFNVIGIANAGFPAKFTGAVFCTFSICSSETATVGMLGGSF